MSVMAPQEPSRVRAGGRRAVGDRTPRPKGPIAADTSVATESSLSAWAGHLPSGRQSFRKQRTVNPLMVPVRYNFLYSSSRSALRAPGPARHNWHSAPAVVNERSTTDTRPGSGAVTIRKRRGGWQVIVSAGPDPLTGWQGIVRLGQLWQDRYHGGFHPTRRGGGVCAGRQGGD
jgi:hypothetical protein